MVAKGVQIARAGESEALPPPALSTGAARRTTSRSCPRSRGRAGRAYGLGAPVVCGSRSEERLRGSCEVDRSVFSSARVMLASRGLRSARRALTRRVSPTSAAITAERLHERVSVPNRTRDRLLHRLNEAFARSRCRSSSSPFTPRVALARTTLAVIRGIGKRTRRTRTPPQTKSDGQHAREVDRSYQLVYTLRLSYGYAGSVRLRERGDLGSSRERSFRRAGSPTEESTNHAEVPTA